jgi:hypothetical protein
MAEESSGYCRYCKSQVLVRRRTPPAVVYALFTLFSCGLWVIPWFLDATYGCGIWRCTRCGLVVADDTPSVGWLFFGIFLAVASIVGAIAATIYISGRIEATG